MKPSYLNYSNRPVVTNFDTYVPPQHVFVDDIDSDNIYDTRFASMSDLNTPDPIYCPRTDAFSDEDSELTEPSADSFELDDDWFLNTGGMHAEWPGEPSLNQRFNLHRSRSFENLYSSDDEDDNSEFSFPEKNEPPGVFKPECDQSANGSSYAEYNYNY